MIEQHKIEQTKRREFPASTTLEFSTSLTKVTLIIKWTVDGEKDCIGGEYHFGNEPEKTAPSYWKWENGEGFYTHDLDIMWKNVLESPDDKEFFEGMKKTVQDFFIMENMQKHNPDVQVDYYMRKMGY